MNLQKFVPSHHQAVLSFQLQNLPEKCVTSGFRREVNEICVLLGYYAAYSGNFLPTLLVNISVLASRVNITKNFVCFLHLQKNVPKRR